MDPCKIRPCKMDPSKLRLAKWILAKLLLAKLPICKNAHLPKCPFAKMLLCQNASLQEIACQNALARCLFARHPIDFFNIYWNEISISICEANENIIHRQFYLKKIKCILFKSYGYKSYML